MLVPANQNTFVYGALSLGSHANVELIITFQHVNDVIAICAFLSHNRIVLDLGVFVNQSWIFLQDFYHFRTVTMFFITVMLL
jgi:hypothetical protein